eukprot:4142529-Alexandrium_andersonii.AAC.1
MAALREIYEETGVEVDAIHQVVHRDVGWSHLHDMYRLSPPPALPQPTAAAHCVLPQNSPLLHG